MQVLLEFLEYLENFSGLVPNTLRLYKRDLLDFELFIKKKHGELFDVTSLSKDDLEDFSTHISNQGSSTATVNRKLTALRKFWNWLKENGKVEKDPFSQIFRESQYRNKSFECLSEEEINLLLDCENLELRTKLILELLYSCCLRVNELLGLTVEDISLNEKIITVVNTRNKKIRLVPITDLLFSLLEAYLEEVELNSVDKLFNISAREVYRIVSKAAQELGINKKITASTLRNSFIKHMKERGAHKVFIQDITGQKNLNEAVFN
ncbi:MAG: tyrosine-type recombinase/integrase [Candidatus Caenarcaniphilales bacterium]|nr:tyrosine-type recombinase/integrase [Candidatus Caenarcaniphilales bacterium]